MIRITLTEKDFLDLVRGWEVKKEVSPYLGYYSSLPPRTEGWIETDKSGTARFHDNVAGAATIVLAGIDWEEMQGAIVRARMESRLPKP